MAPLAQLTSFLREHHGEILSRWLAAVRDCTPACRLPDPELTDHMPLVLTHVTDAVDAVAAGEWSAIPTASIRQHAATRLRESFELGEVVTELFLLRHVLFEIVFQGRTSETRQTEIPALAWAVDAAIRESAEEYTRARQQILWALDLAVSASPVGTRETRSVPHFVDLGRSDHVVSQIRVPADD